MASDILPPTLARTASLQIVVLWDTECYATEIEQSALGAITKPIDQVGAFITAVVLFGNVIPRLWPARILLVESIQFRKIALGAPLLSISRNAAEWLADLNDSVTLLLSPVLNVFNGDTECYPSLALMVHSVFWLVWSHSDMESSSTHSVYSFESVETTVIVISCGRASSGLELISALDKALPMFDLRDTECYLVHSVLILPVVPYCNWMPSAFDMVT